MKITAEKANECGNIDVYDVFQNKSTYVSKTLKTAHQHANRYIFASKFIKNKSVLDVACGTGYGSEFLNGNYNKYLGVDIDKNSIELANSRFGGFSNTKFIIGDVCNLNAKDLGKNFDVVISFETIEHIRCYDSFLDEVYSILNYGGELIISTPNRNITNPGASFSDRPKWELHLQEWILEEFTKLLENHKFFVERVYGQSFHPLKIISKLLRGSTRSLKFMTQSVFPLKVFAFFSEPNFYIIRAKKI